MQDNAFKVKKTVGDLFKDSRNGELFEKINTRLEDLKNSRNERLGNMMEKIDRSDRLGGMKERIGRRGF